MNNIIKKRVGIITFHFPYNYGSALQSYALQNFLQRKYKYVRIIDFIYDFDMEEYKIFHFHQYIHRPKRIIRDIMTLVQRVERRYSFIQFKKNTINLLNADIIAMIR